MPRRRICIRVRNDTFAFASGFFVIALVVAAFGGAPLAAHLLGHGPNATFITSVDVMTHVPCGFWCHATVAPYASFSPTTLLILGGDGPLGRDRFLRLLYGARASLEVALLATFISVALGVVVGVVAGHLRGWTGAVSRQLEVVMLYPLILFVVVLRFVFPQLPYGVVSLALILSAVGWVYPARIVCGVISSLRGKEFVAAARMAGASDLRILRLHLLPYLVAPTVVVSCLIVAQSILAEAGVSALGLGIHQDASWGNMLVPDSFAYPILWILPGLAVLLAALAFTLLGQGLGRGFDRRARISTR